MKKFLLVGVLAVLFAVGCEKHVEVYAGTITNIESSGTRYYVIVTLDDGTKTIMRMYTSMHTGSKVYKTEWHGAWYYNIKRGRG